MSDEEAGRQDVPIDSREMRLNADKKLYVRRYRRSNGDVETEISVEDVFNPALTAALLVLTEQQRIDLGTLLRDR